MRDKDKFSDIYLLVVKPNTVWEEVLDKRICFIIPMTETNGTALIMDLDKEHCVEEFEKFKAVSVPRRFKKVLLKNATDAHTSYLIMKKGKE